MTAPATRLTVTEDKRTVTGVEVRGTRGGPPDRVTARPVASTTRSAGSTEEAAPSRLGMIVTPVTRWPRPADARPTA